MDISRKEEKIGYKLCNKGSVGKRRGREDEGEGEFGSPTTSNIVQRRRKGEKNEEEK